jgi:cytochrome c6
MKRSIPTLFLAVASLFFATLALRAAAKPDGAALYKQKCAMCHGRDGKGYAALKTPDFTSAKWQKSVTDKALVEVIKNGKKGTAMPGFADKLKQDEIQSLVKYLRSLGGGKKK